MSAAIPIIWNGVNYPSISQAAVALGIAINTMHDRYRRGYTCDADMPYQGGVFRSGAWTPCKWNDIEYDSIAAAARATGRWYSLMYRHIKKGYSCDADIPSSGHKPASTTWNGITYKTIKAAAIANGLTYNALQERMASGYTSDKDMKRNKRVFWNGIEYETLTRAAKICGISHQAMSLRISKGYTCDADMKIKPKWRDG